MANDQEREPQAGEEHGHAASSGKHGHGGGGHGGGHEEGHEGAPEWLISFADNVTLMMGFFVILLALNMKPAASGSGGSGGAAGGGAESTSPEMLDWVIGVRAAFNNPVDVASTDPRDQLLVQRLMVRAGRGQAAEPGPKGKFEETQTIRPSDYVGAGGVVTFEPGSSELSSDGRASAEDIARNLRGFTSVIELRGHTSAAEAHELANGGASLAYARALAVAEIIAAEGIEWRRLRLIACGAAEPLTAPAYNESSHRSNQRVEVIVTDRSVRDNDAPTPPESAGTTPN
jgi:outer membrane protein OmpA-like peptidoglycan-associated protein